MCADLYCPYISERFDYFTKHVVCINSIFVSVTITANGAESFKGFLLKAVAVGQNSAVGTLQRAVPPKLCVPTVGRLGFQPLPSFIPSFLFPKYFWNLQ